MILVARGPAFIYKGNTDPMMSRQSGYKHRHLMSPVDTDIYTPERMETPSPPPTGLSHIPKYDSEWDNHKEIDGEPPQTPYYDYACNNPFKKVN